MTLRRDFFAFTAGAVVARTVLPAVAQAAERPDVGTVPDESQDAELLSWCAALLAMDAAWRRQMLDGDADLPPAYHATLARVTATPALTDAGNKAKLAVAVSFYEPDYDINSIVDDILWDAVKALALPPHVAPVTTQHADADLLALCTEFQGYQHECDEWEAGRISEEDGNDASADWWQAMEAVDAQPATTLHGVKAKAKVLQHVIGVIGQENNGLDSLALSLCRDLLAGVA